ncbi:ATP-binding cassette domain-containing protein [Streptosporangium sp. NPDC020072]|uniref:ATP-binding cassette domain-containing protein n=1 Tax=Streptosporangium sp. NPDC020072 TaxID=3154788 RepID=UPI003435C732
MIEVRNLTKRHRGRAVVDDLSFTVEPGHVTGFLGRNGAGKSTTMRLMLGLDHPCAGRVLFDGVPYRRLPEPLRRVGVVLSPPAVHPGRTAFDHLLWLARTNRVPRGRVGEVLETVGLTGAARQRAGSLSLGMTQRLGIAAALLGDPPVLLLDEPVNGLDPEGVLWIRGMLRTLAAEGRTVFFSSHLMGETALTAERLVVIGGGRLLADTTVRRFVEDNARSHVRLRTPEPGRMREALAMAGIQAGTAEDGSLEVHGVEAAGLGELAAANGVTLHEVSTQSPSLEEAFMRLTGAEAGARTEAGRR